VNPPPIEPPCNTIVYRTIRRHDWFDSDDDECLVDAAFMRRRPKLDQHGSVVDPGDDDGLSLYDSFHIGPQECIEEELSCHGLATLHVGTLRDLGLEIIRDPENHRKVLVTNVPFTNPGTAEEEDLLDKIAQCARIHTRCKWKKPR
jgi:hypothetical protein